MAPPVRGGAGHAAADRQHVVVASAHVRNHARHMRAISESHVARPHYARALSKQDIAARLRISPFKVARVLDAARSEGNVRIEIAEPLATDDVASAGSRAATDSSSRW